MRSNTSSPYWLGVALDVADASQVLLLLARTAQTWGSVPGSNDVLNLIVDSSNTSAWASMVAAFNAASGSRCARPACACAGELQQGSGRPVRLLTGAARPCSVLSARSTGAAALSALLEIVGSSVTEQAQYAQLAAWLQGGAVLVPGLSAAALGDADAVTGLSAQQLLLGRAWSNVAWVQRARAPLCSSLAALVGSG